MDVLEAGQPTCPEDVSRTTGKPLWRVSRKTWRISSTRISSRSVTTGADMAAATGTRSSAFFAVGSRGSHGTHFTYGHTRLRSGACKAPQCGEGRPQTPPISLESQTSMWGCPVGDGVVQAQYCHIIRKDKLLTTLNFLLHLSLDKVAAHGLRG